MPTPTPSRRRLLAAATVAAIPVTAAVVALSSGAGASCLPGHTPQPTGDINGDCLPDPTLTPSPDTDPPDNPIDDAPDWLLPRDALKIVAVARTIAAGRYRDVTAYCPEGSAAITGGYQLSRTDMRASKSWPLPSYGGIAETIGWQVRAVAPVRSGTVQVYAVCAEVAP